MGNATSSVFSATNLVNEALTTTIINVSNNCSSDSNNAQEIGISNINAIGCSVNINDIAQNQKITTDFTCVQNTDNSSMIKNQFESQLKQDLSAAVSGLNVNLNSQSDVESVTNITNKIVNTIDMNTVSNCIANTIASQKITIDGIRVDCTNMPAGTAREVNIGNLKQLMVNTSTASCTQTNSNLTSAINELQTLVDNKIKADTSGISSTAIIMIIVVIIIICVVGLAIFMGFNPLSIFMKIFTKIKDTISPPVEPKE